MFPSYNEIGNPGRRVNKDRQFAESLCPLGCLCCIMQQFYNKRCWCKEVKESTATQTDPEDIGIQTRANTKQKVTVTTATQTEYSDLFLGVLQRAVMTDDESDDQSNSKDKGLTDCGAKPTSVLSPRETPSVQETGSDVHSLLPDANRGNVSTFLDTYRHSGMRIKRQRKPDPEWKSYTCHGTVEHTQLQCAVKEMIDKFNLSGAKDPNFEKALIEILDLFPVLKDSMYSKHMVRSKLRHRISSKRHYTRIRSEASTCGIAVSALKRKRVEENAIQQKLLGQNIVHSSLSSASPPLSVPTVIGNWVNSAASGTSSTTSHHILPTGSSKMTSTTTHDHILNLTSCSKREIDSENNTDEKALDLSDPRHDVIIKIEPLDPS